MIQLFQLSRKSLGVTDLKMYLVQLQKLSSNDHAKTNFHRIHKQPRHIEREEMQSALKSSVCLWSEKCKSCSKFSGVRWLLIFNTARPKHSMASNFACTPVQAPAKIFWLASKTNSMCMWHTGYIMKHAFFLPAPGVSLNNLHTLHSWTRVWKTALCTAHMHANQPAGC